MKRIAIVGGGIAGLAAAYEVAQLAREGVAVEATVFESSNRFGGLIETVREGGFTVEGGPDGWVSAKPWARELALELGLGDEMVPSNDATRKTWILLSTPENPTGRLVAMPAGFNMMVPTDLSALDDSPLFSDAAIAAYWAGLYPAPLRRGGAGSRGRASAQRSLRRRRAQAERARGDAGVHCDGA
jgi:oxygen-dependent protoporphyrinogen oxidase